MLDWAISLWQDATDLTLTPQKSQSVGAMQAMKIPPHGTRHDSNKGPWTCTRDPTPLGHRSWGIDTTQLNEFKHHMFMEKISEDN